MYFVIILEVHVHVYLCIFLGDVLSPFLFLVVFFYRFYFLMFCLNCLICKYNNIFYCRYIAKIFTNLLWYINITITFIFFWIFFCLKWYFKIKKKIVSLRKEKEIWWMNLCLIQCKCFGIFLYISNFFFFQNHNIWVNIWTAHILLKNLHIHVCQCTSSTAIDLVVFFCFFFLELIQYIVQSLYFEDIMIYL